MATDIDKGMSEELTPLEDLVLRIVAIGTAILSELIASREQAALQPFKDAINNAGSHPDYHAQQILYLKEHWPTLYNLLAELTNTDREHHD